MGDAGQLGEDEQDGADRDGGVGHIEGRPVEAGGVPLDEIDNGTEAHAVNHIAQGAAHDEGQGQREQLLLRMPPDLDSHPGRNTQRQDGKEPALPAWLISQEAKGSARVESQHPVPERRNVDGFAELDVVEDDPLAELIEDDDQAGKVIPAIRGVFHASQSSSNKPGMRENSAVLWVTRMAP